MVLVSRQLGYEFFQFDAVYSQKYREFLDSQHILRGKTLSFFTDTTKKPFALSIPTGECKAYFARCLKPFWWILCAVFWQYYCSFCCVFLHHFLRNAAVVWHCNVSKRFCCLCLFLYHCWWSIAWHKLGYWSLVREHTGRRIGCCGRWLHYLLFLVLHKGESVAHMLSYWLWWKAVF